MWQAEYFESLTPLWEALDEMGPSTQLLRVSLAKNDTETWDHSFAVDVVASVPTMLEILEDNGFFFLFDKLSTLARGLKTAGLLSDEWKASEGNNGDVENLVPVFRLLVHLAPRKVYDSLCCLRDFLEEVGGDNWDGENCVRCLTRIQQGLEEMAPKNTLNYLAQLHDFLTFQHRFLAWLACHPDVEEKVGNPNFFDTLIIARKVLGLGMDYYSDCLIDLQEILEDLNELEAIVHYPDDLDV
ncbi:uncharacterized protein PHA67_020228 isoform 1-T2 [Liasis olivaceus]